MSDSIHERGTNVHSKSDLPPPRNKKGIRTVSPPLSNVPLHRFMYYMGLFAAIFVAFYCYRLFQWKAEVGGWWNLALGRHPTGTNEGAGMGYTGGAPAPTPVRSGGRASVDQRIEELAVALGIPSKELASAIAGAVREYVPPASLSSVAAHESGGAAQYLVDPTSASLSEAENAPGATATWGVKKMANAVEAVVGLDEPPNGFDSA